MLIGAIVGATGVGKTELSITLARQLDAEIICMDSRQIYRGMAIGTAQPTVSQREQVAHHLVDCIAPDVSYNVAQYLADVRAIVEANPHQKYLCVGGTGMYLQALQQGLSPLPAADVDLRQRLERVQQRRGQSFMYKWAQKLDPQGAKRIERNNSQRIMRLIEVSLQSGIPFSQMLANKKGGWGEFPVLWVNLPRAELYERINLRVQQMLDEGWGAEALALAQQYAVECPGLQSLGYREIIAQNGNMTPKNIENIARQTRNYAKRQITWFKNQIKSVEISPKTAFFEKKENILKYFTNYP